MSNATIRISLASATKIADEFLKLYVPQGIVAGSIRRKSPTIGDIDIMTMQDLQSLEKTLLNAGLPMIVNGSKIVHVIFKEITINIYRYDKQYEGAMLMFLTGPSGYNIGYRSRANSMGYKLNQYGLFNGIGKCIAGDTEESIYKALGKSWKAPELRGTK